MKLLNVKLFLTESDVKSIKHLEEMQRTFRKGEDLLKENQKDTLHNNWNKLKGIIKKEKILRKSVLAKINTAKMKIRSLRTSKLKNAKAKIFKLKLEVNKLYQKWYGKNYYKSTAIK